VSALRRDEDTVSDPERTAAERLRTAALRQTVFREVNEQIERLERTDLLGPLAALCECGHPDCSEGIEISADDYEAVRLFPTRFLVKPGHQQPETERIADRYDGYLVVEKIGPSSLAAVRFDPRRPTRHHTITLSEAR
jgi:hypothetical protein